MSAESGPMRLGAISLWLLILPILLAGCTNSVRLESPLARTPDFVLQKAETPQEIIELELQPTEVTEFRSFLDQLTDIEHRTLVVTIAQLDEGKRGYFVASEILPDPEMGTQFAQVTGLIGEGRSSELGAALNLDLYGRWRGLRNAFARDLEHALIADTLSLFLRGGDCLYSLCDESVMELNEAWNYAPVRMINSEPAAEGEAPWQIQLLRAGKDSTYYNLPIRAREEMEKYGRVRESWERNHVCGAIYIGENFALTAAHCVEGWEGYDDEFFDGRRIRAGSTDIAIGGEIIPISGVVIHRDYKDGLAYKGYDIALLTLERMPAAPATSRLRIPLYPRNGQKPGTKLSQTGWGLTGATDNSQLARDMSGNLQASSRFLRIGELTLLDPESCNSNDEFAARGVSIQSGQICVGSDVGVDACKGDSGGPLVRIVENRIPILIGIVSWGIGCGYDKRPAIYTDVGSFYDWIKRAKKRTRPGRLVRVR